MINLEIPKKFEPLVQPGPPGRRPRCFRPISRKYDVAEHAYPKELDMLAALIDGMNEGGDIGGAGAAGVRRDERATATAATATAPTSPPCSAIIELCWGDVGLLLSMPRQGLGNSAIASVATTSSWSASAASGRRWRSPSPRPAPTRPRSARPPTLDGDEYVLNGEKIFVTSGDRADLIVVWATLDRTQGRAAIKSFVVERDNPGLKLDRLEHKLGIRASDTANFILEDCRVPKENLLGSPEIDTKKGFAGVMQTFDNTRPLVAAMAVGVARACARARRASCSPRPASRSTTTRRRCRQSRRRRRASSRWRPTTRRRAC